MSKSKNFKKTKCTPSCKLKQQTSYKCSLIYIKKYFWALCLEPSWQPRLFWRERLLTQISSNEIPDWLIHFIFQNEIITLITFASISKCSTAAIEVIVLAPKKHISLKKIFFVQKSLPIYFQLSELFVKDYLDLYVLTFAHKLVSPLLHTFHVHWSNTP